METELSFSSYISDLGGVRFSRNKCIFVIFTPEYLIWGAANVDGIVLLTSNSICSLLLYRKEFDFCILTLHLSTLL